MRKLIGMLGLALLGASVVLAETDPKAREELRSIRFGENNKDQIQILRVEGAATIGGALTASGAVNGSSVGSATPVYSLLVSNANSKVYSSNIVVKSGGTLTIPEGAVTDSTIVSADIKNGEIVNADVSSTAGVTGDKLNLLSGVRGLSSTGTVQGAVVNVQDSASGFPGTLRVGYVTSDGWQVTTTGGGTELVFLRDFASTGMVTKASITTDGNFRDGLLKYGTTQCWFQVIGTQLQFVVSGVASNVVDADILNP